MPEIKAKERPITFSTAMVEAILDGRKTQTRRVVDPKSSLAHSGIARIVRLGRDRWEKITERGNGYATRCRYGMPGDRLWVKEALRPSATQIVVYRQDGCPAFQGTESVRWPWKPDVLQAMYMPRWASRITLELTGVRVQRLQDISGEDAHSEGMLPTRHGFCIPHFMATWDALNKSRGFGWDSNPWVWALTFKIINQRNQT